MLIERQCIQLFKKKKKIFQVSMLKYKSASTHHFFSEISDFIAAYSVTPKIIALFSDNICTYYYPNCLKLYIDRKTIYSAFHEKIFQVSTLKYKRASAHHFFFLQKFHTLRHPLLSIDKKQSFLFLIHHLCKIF